MEIVLSFVVATLVIALGYTISVYHSLRAKSLQQDAKLRRIQRALGKPDDATKRPEAPVMAEYDSNMDIPAALIGARCKEIIETFAPVCGTTPVNLLRAAIAEGLTGGKPVLQETLEILEEIRREEAEEMRLPAISPDEKDPRKPS